MRKSRFNKLKGARKTVKMPPNIKNNVVEKT